MKEGIGSAALSLHPEVARSRIRDGAERALRNLSRFKPYDLASPYTLVLTMKDEVVVYNGSFYPGAERTGEWELTFTADNIIDVMAAYSFMRR